jgi:hypothetical protein
MQGKVAGSNSDSLKIIVFSQSERKPTVQAPGAVTAPCFDGSDALILHLK